MLSFLKPKPAPVGCCCGGKIPALSSLLSPVPDILLPRKLALVSPAQPSEAAPTKLLLSLHAFPQRSLPSPLGAEASAGAPCPPRLQR